MELFTSLVVIGALVAVYYAVQKIRASRAKRKAQSGGGAPGAGGGDGPPTVLK